jgi:protein-tyrosine phosphatase
MSALLRRLEGSIARRYGRKQGLCRHAVFAALYRSGGLRRFAAVDWSRVERLVFVCHGNICRSPYAEARARGAGLAATSLGLLATAGRPAETAAVAAARRRGIDLSGHRSRGPDAIPLGSSDLVLGMEPWHATRVAAVARAGGLQVALLGLWCDRPRPHLEDPFGLSPEYFDTCFALIDAAVARIATLVRRAEAGPA